MTTTTHSSFTGMTTQRQSAPLIRRHHHHNISSYSATYDNDAVHISDLSPAWLHLYMALSNYIQQMHRYNQFIQSNRQQQRQYNRYGQQTQYNRSRYFLRNFFNNIKRQRRHSISRGSGRNTNTIVSTSTDYTRMDMILEETKAESRRQWNAALQEFASTTPNSQQVLSELLRDYFPYLGESTSLATALLDAVAVEQQIAVATTTAHGSRITNSSILNKNTLDPASKDAICQLLTSNWDPAIHCCSICLQNNDEEEGCSHHFQHDDDDDDDDENDYQCNEDHRGLVKHMPCGHSFHASCLHKWLSRQRTCPICRFELSD